MSELNIVFVKICEQCYNPQYLKQDASLYYMKIVCVSILYEKVIGFSYLGFPIGCKLKLWPICDLPVDTSCSKGLFYFGKNDFDRFRNYVG